MAKLTIWPKFLKFSKYGALTYYSQILKFGPPIWPILKYAFSKSNQFLVFTLHCMILVPKTSTLEVHPIIFRTDIMSSFVYFRVICLCMHFPRHLPYPFEVNLIYTYVVSANKLKSCSCTCRFNCVKQKYHYTVRFSQAR